MPLSQRLPNSDDRELLYITDILGKKVNKFTSLKKICSSLHFIVMEMLR